MSSIVPTGKNEPVPSDPTMPRFHLAIPVDDLDAARDFYGRILGCEQGRSSTRWVDWNMRGHQLVTHLVETQSSVASNPVDGHDVPVPHFGMIMGIDEFHLLAARLQDGNVRFGIDPYLRFEGLAGEQWTMFVYDPAGNALEFKAFADDAQVFAV
jgi:extradiol dioxygenase family protein